MGYLDGDGNRVFVVHLYLRSPTASDPAPLGASGRPDPKWLYENGTTFELLRDED